MAAENPTRINDLAILPQAARECNAARSRLGARARRSEALVSASG
jgi:hypothetical protein